MTKPLVRGKSGASMARQSKDRFLMRMDKLSEKQSSIPGHAKTPTSRIVFSTPFLHAPLSR